MAKNEYSVFTSFKTISSTSVNISIYLSKPKALGFNLRKCCQPPVSPVAIVRFVSDGANRQKRTPTSCSVDSGVIFFITTASGYIS